MPLSAACTRAPTSVDARPAIRFSPGPDPMRSASNTVVTPDAAICASCATTAGIGSQKRFGRGWKWDSTWSV